MNMKRSIVREWCCEHVDKYGDILQHDFGGHVEDVWPAQMEYDGLTPRLVAIRLAGNDEDGENERGYAYKGEAYYSCGHAVPKYLLSQFDNIENVLEDAK